MELENLREYSYVVQEINSRGRGTLATPIEHVNPEIVKDFYTNVKSNNEAPLAIISWVRGREVPYDRDVCKEYIEDNYVAHYKKLDPFSI